MDEVGLGKALQEARRKGGMTQQDLCHAAELSYSTLAKIERGAIKSPSVFTVARIAQVLNMSVDSLLGLQPAAALASGKKTAKSGAKFVYFDVNGCIVQFTHNAFAKMSQDYNVSVSQIQGVFWEYDLDINRGDKQVEDLNRALSELLGAEIDWLDYYLQTTEPIGGMHELLTWAAEHYRIGLLTNSMPGFVDALRAVGKIPDVPFDVIVDSSTVKAVKPESTIYEEAIRQSGHSGKEILFVDDLQANLAAAQRQFGWNTIWFDPYRPDISIATIRQALEY